MYCVGGVAMKLFTSQKVTGSNPAGCKVNFLHCVYPLVPVVGTGTKGGFGTRTKGCLCSSVTCYSYFPSL